MCSTRARARRAGGAGCLNNDVRSRAPEPEQSSGSLHLNYYYNAFYCCLARPGQLRFALNITHSVCRKYACMSVSVCACVRVRVRVRVSHTRAHRQNKRARACRVCGSGKLSSRRRRTAQHVCVCTRVCDARQTNTQMRWPAPRTQSCLEGVTSPPAPPQ